MLPHIILGVMSTGDEFVLGKHIVEYFQAEVGEFWQAAHSQIYPELKRMTKDGWITVHPVPGNIKEKQYSLTDLGREKLSEWMEEPNRDTPQHRDIFSLKMFFIKKMDDERIPGMIEEQIEVLNKHLKRLEIRKDTLFSDPEFISNNYGHYLILKRAIARNRAQIAWLEENLEEYRILQAKRN
ncbi:PadR family transcriptional regulator [Streptococcus sp. X13SY08]